VLATLTNFGDSGPLNYIAIAAATVIVQCSYLSQCVSECVRVPGLENLGFWKQFFLGFGFLGFCRFYCTKKTGHKITM